MRYVDILYQTRPEPKTRPRMPIADRAAQFSSFSALTGYEESVKEATRFTERKIELSEEEKEMLDYKIQSLLPEEYPEVSITYFLRDRKKEGGEYRKTTGKIQKIDLFQRVIIMEDGKRIPLEDVLDI